MGENNAGKKYNGRPSGDASDQNCRSGVTFEFSTLQPTANMSFFTGGASRAPAGGVNPDKIDAALTECVPTSSSSTQADDAQAGHHHRLLQPDGRVSAREMLPARH